MDELIAENIESISDYFDMELVEGKKCYMGCCPIHGGDNPTAFNFYTTEGYGMVGNWVCNTHQCHEFFGRNAMGLIRGLLSVKNHNWSQENDKNTSFGEAVSWCEEFFKTAYKGTKKTNTISGMINRLYTKKSLEYAMNITQDQYLKSGITFPDKYFLNRGYSEKTLNEFSVGFCSNASKPMYNRSIVPLHNANGTRIIGCSGRMVWSRCDVCRCFHDPKKMCPNKDYRGMYSKWKHSKAFPSEHSLYSFHRAKKPIGQTGIAILTEGQPNVWRLFEAGFPMSLGCFGANFTPEQKKRLDSAGAHTIIIVPDADEASEKFVKKIIELCKNSYNIVTIEPSYDDDIGECNIDTVKTILSPFIEKYHV
jgi:hypothetical protein